MWRYSGHNWKLIVNKMELCENSSVVSGLLELWRNQTAGGDGLSAGDLDPKDASWILTTALIIFTMQTGKGPSGSLIRTAINTFTGEGFDLWSWAVIHLNNQ